MVRRRRAHVEWRAEWRRRRTTKKGGMEDTKRIENVQAPSIKTSVSSEQKPAMYFTFKDFLTLEEAATFFDWPHWRQVDKVAAYLEFVAKQPAAAQFTSSARASTSWAELRSERAS